MNNSKIIEALLEVRELISDYVDITDGGPLGPNPNDAMRAQMLIDEVVGKIPDYAALLRATIEHCPNDCPGELRESEHTDGLHVTCAECGFWATEEWVKRIAERING